MYYNQGLNLKSWNSDHGKTRTWVFQQIIIFLFNYSLYFFSTWCHGSQIVFDWVRCCFDYKGGFRGTSVHQSVWLEAGAWLDIPCAASHESWTDQAFHFESHLGTLSHYLRCQRTHREHEMQSLQISLVAVLCQTVDTLHKATHWAFGTVLRALHKQVTY